MIAINLSKQQALLDADRKSIQQIIFTANLDRKTFSFLQNQKNLC